MFDDNSNPNDNNRQAGFSRPSQSIAWVCAGMSVLSALFSAAVFIGVATRELRGNPVQPRCAVCDEDRTRRLLVP